MKRSKNKSDDPDSSDDSESSWRERDREEENRKKKSKRAKGDGNLKRLPKLANSETSKRASKHIETGDVVILSSSSLAAELVGESISFKYGDQVEALVKERWRPALVIETRGKSFIHVVYFYL